MAAAESKPRIHTFLVVREPARPDHILVWDTQDLTVGRSSENELSVDMAELSRMHAVFRREGELHVVRHLSHSNETLVAGEPIRQHTLKSGEVVRMADLEILFYQGPKNPLTAGLKVEYASQLKQFTGIDATADSGDVTMLGLTDALPDDSERDALAVAPPGDSGYDLQVPGESPRAPARDLDLEIGPEGESRSLSLHLELSGLTPDLRAVVGQLVGKDIELPRLRIRIKADDLG